MRTILRTSITASMAVVMALTLASGASAQEATQLNTVTVEARRTVDVEPDLGIVTLGVRSKGRTADAATEKLTAKTRNVLDALRGAGFTNAELSTVSVNLDRSCLRNCRDRNPDDNIRPEPVYGYRASAGVRLETGKLDQIGRAIDVGINAGATSIRGVTFDVKDKAAAVNEALRQAMVVAIDKATILAEGAGRQRGPALIITEGRTQAPFAYDVPRAATVAYADAIAGTGAGGSASNPFPIEPPTLSASARIEVTFELI